MIVEFALRIGEMMINAVFGILDILPSMPSGVVSAIDWLFSIMMSAINLVGILIDLNMVRILIPIVIAILNFDKIYHFIMFVLKKIPFLDMK